MKNVRAARFKMELKIVDVLKERLEKGDGFTRITMKEDGQQIDIDLCGDGKYHISFPPYYGDRDYGVEMRYKPLDKWFKGLDEIAEFLLRKGWMQVW